MKKLIIILVLLAAALSITFVLKPDVLNSPASRGGLYEVNPEIQNEKIILQDYIRYVGAEGKTAFELLREAAEVQYKQYDFGVFVESINGVRPDEKRFWKLYLNGAEAQVGADKLQTREGDVIEWRLEEMM